MNNEQCKRRTSIIHYSLFIIHYDVKKNEAVKTASFFLHHTAHSARATGHWRRTFLFRFLGNHTFR
jgi:hypothetical protein